MAKDTVIAVISDMHGGSSVAVTPPRWNLYDGGTYTASPAQKIIHRQWIKSAKEILACRTEGRGKKRLVLILNGEPIDGDHHDTAQLVTKNTKEQMDMAITLLDEWMQVAEFEPKRKDCMYLVRGTSAHEKGEYIEEIGRDLDGVIPYRRDSSSTTKDGRYSHEKLRKLANGVLFDIAHHGFSRGYRAWTRSRSIRYALESAYFDALDSGVDIADYYIRSHLHTYTQAIYTGRQKTLHGCITPGWKLKDHFTSRVGANNPLNTIGMIYYDVLKSGASQHFAEFIEVEDTKVEEF